MRAMTRSLKVACVTAILVFSLPFTSSLSPAVSAGQAFCASGTCYIELGSICAGDGTVQYNARYEPL